MELYFLVIVIFINNLVEFENHFVFLSEAYEPLQELKPSGWMKTMPEVRITLTFTC